MNSKSNPNQKPRNTGVIEASGIEEANSPDFIAMQSVPLTIEAAGDEKSPPSFSMVAYTGGVMRVTGFPHPVVVDLNGLDTTRQNVPTRLDHKASQGVGHTSSIAIKDGKLIAEGVISRDTSWARDVASSGAKGFPWQASIGAAVIQAEFVRAGQSVRVNDKNFDGPIHVVRRSILKEISFVDSGADGNTSASIAAKETTEMTFKQWLQAQGIEQSSLTETGIKTLKAAYKSENDAGSEGDKKGTKEKPEKKIEATDSQSDTINAQSIEDQIQASRSAHAAETERIGAIRRICSGQHSDIEAKAIAEGWDENKTELHILRASRPSAPSVHIPRDVSSPQVFVAAALMTSGMSLGNLEASYNEQTLNAADRIRGAGIQEFASLVCGTQLPSFKRDPIGWLEAAFSTTSLPGILSNIANKKLLEGYNYVEDAWRKIVKIASVNDFKEHTRYRMNGSFKFEQVGPDGELKHGSLSEQKFTQKADTHGIMFALTREMIVNDDMGAFADIPFQVGLGAGEAISDAVWTLLLSNPILPDGKALFHADHKNLLTGADTALSIDGLTKAEIAFMNQTKPDGRPLGVPARKLVVPTALKVIAEQLMTALMVNETTTANTPKAANNPHAGKYEVVSSSYPANASFSGNSSKAWYLCADPNRLAALEVAFLSAKDSPTVERADADFNTLGVQFRGYIDFGVKEQDHRGALKMKGEA